MDSQSQKHLPAQGQCPQQLFVLPSPVCMSKARMVKLGLHYCLPWGLVLGSALAA